MKWFTLIYYSFGQNDVNKFRVRVRVSLSFGHWCGKFWPFAIDRGHCHNFPVDRPIWVTTGTYKNCPGLNTSTLQFSVVIVAPRTGKNWYFNFWCPPLRCLTRYTQNFVRHAMWSWKSITVKIVSFHQMSTLWMSVLENCYNSIVNGPICTKSQRMDNKVLTLDKSTCLRKHPVFFFDF